MAERGEFTRKFDRDILNDKEADAEEKAVQRKRELAADASLEAELLKVLNVLDYRASWLRDRFKNVTEPKSVDFRGRRFEFPDPAGKVVGWIEFRTKLSESGQAILIESFMELEGAFNRKYDYVSFPKDAVNVDRVRRFVESKIIEFAGPYQDRHVKRVGE